MTYLGEEIKKLGFGLMRLPKCGEDIDVEQVKAMVDRFLAAGFIYFDTAWAYPGSEDAIRQALVERYPRESFQLATKNAAWINCKTREEATHHRHGAGQGRHACHAAGTGGGNTAQEESDCVSRLVGDSLCRQSRRDCPA